MATIRKEQREVLDRALAIGTAVERERSRHRNANEKIMVRAAENVYAAHLVNMIDSTGFAPLHSGAQGRVESRDAAQAGKVLTARAYAFVIGYSESYISRLFRLGFGMAAGVLDPDEESSNGPTRWQLLSRTLGDTPEIGAVLGKEVDTLPTVETLEAAIEAAQIRKRDEQADAATKRAEVPEGPIPKRPSEQIELLEDLVGTIEKGRHLTERQIERVQRVMDEMREFIEEWIEQEKEGANGHQKAS